MRFSIFNFQFSIARRFLLLASLSPCLLVFSQPARAQATPTPVTLTATAPTTRATAAAVPAAEAMPHTTTIPFTPMPAPAPKTPVKKAPAPTAAVDNKTCTTAECHPEVKEYKAVHGPVNVNACDACHTLKDAAKHTYELSRPKNQICTFCHKTESVSGMGGPNGPLPIVHQPVKTGDCLPCHNPHGGKTSKFIRGDSMLQVCNQCHQDPVGKKKNVHGPVAAGACEACHSPHASKNPKLLVEQGKALCLTCHKEMGDQLRNAKVTHKPVMQGECSACHDAHASDNKMQVKADPLTLCTSCHEHDKIKDAATSATHKHSIVTQDQACLNCHTAHGGPLAKLMKAQPVDVCIKCHKQDQKAPDGHVVKAVPEVMDAKLIKHGPVKDGNCSGCHNVHGSNETRLLSKPYPESFYAKFDPENFALCFSCHDKKLVETKEAEGLTGFRNGTQNLHYMHVDKDKGRTCRACHETHASPNPVHIRESVPYGQWQLPVNFNKSATGGTCAPGCHKEYGYDRTKPVDNGTKPATGTTPVAPTPVVPTPASAGPTAAPAAPVASAPAPAAAVVTPATTAASAPAPIPATIPTTSLAPVATAPAPTTAPAPATQSRPGVLNLPQ